MDWLTDILGSTGFGGLLGGIFSIFTKREDRKLVESRQNHEREMRGMDMQEQQMTQQHEITLADKQIQRAESEGKMKNELLESEGFVNSLKNATVNTGVAIVDAVRGLMRPLITVYLMIMTSYIAYRVSTLVGGIEALPVTEIYDLYREIILQVLCLTSLAVAWWFGSRPPKTAGDK